MVPNRLDWVTVTGRMHIRAQGRATLYSWKLLTFVVVDFFFPHKRSSWDGTWAAGGCVRSSHQPLVVPQTWHKSFHLSATLLMHIHRMVIQPWCGWCCRRPTARLCRWLTQTFYLLFHSPHSWPVWSQRVSSSVAELLTTLSGPVYDIFITAGDAHDDWGGEVAAYGPWGWPKQHTQSHAICLQGCKSTYTHPQTVVWLYRHTWADRCSAALQLWEVWAEPRTSATAGLILPPELACFLFHPWLYSLLNSHTLVPWHCWSWSAATAKQETHTLMSCGGNLTIVASKCRDKQELKKQNQTNQKNQFHLC